MGYCNTNSSFCQVNYSTICICLYNPPNVIINQLIRGGMATLYQQIGQRIQTLRKQAGMTQEELSERADLSNTYIAMIEAGKRSPSIKALDKIAMALQVGITDLFGFSSNSPKIKTARTNNLSLTKTEALAIRTAVRILHKKTWSLN